MKVVFSKDQLLQHGKSELFGNKLVPVHETPVRAEAILARVREVDLGEVIVPRDFGLEPLKRVHDEDYLVFLESAWADWVATGGNGDALPPCTPMHDMTRQVPTSIWGRLSYYSFDCSAPITANTWTAARASANTALEAVELIAKGERAAFALCRPPGHHASRDYYGGYCFINNAAVAAMALRDAGIAHVAVLDVDYHHGNGTQSIFYDRGDVFFASIHGDPDEDYPFFLGRADETGVGAGQGCNANYPLPHGAAWPDWSAALNESLSRIAGFRADALVVSVGVDTYEGDPLTFFRLTGDDFTRMGERLGQVGLPTLFVMEGGYDVAHIGHNAVNVLQGFEAASSPSLR